jgi:hypothetical protein
VQGERGLADARHAYDRHDAGRRGWLGAGPVQQVRQRSQLGVTADELRCQGGQLAGHGVRGARLFAGRGGLDLLGAALPPVRRGDEVRARVFVQR